MLRSIVFLLVAVLAPFPRALAITTAQHPSTMKAGSRIVCTLMTPIDTATAAAGDDFTLLVRDPAYLRGAKITGHLTRVAQPRGINRARIDFLFDSIVFVNGRKEPIRAYVVAAGVVHRAAQPPQNAVTPPPAPFAASPSTIVWQTQLGAKTRPSSQTGGYAYADRSGAQIVARAGTHVTLELASNLALP
jgi:hypothetical protein